VSPLGGAPFEGIAVAIEDDGSVAVRRDDGSTDVVTAADVSLRPLG
jgi:biotin-(acetyl-CoA carboxylase) ligase